MDNYVAATMLLFYIQQQGHLNTDYVCLEEMLI